MKEFIPPEPTLDIFKKDDNTVKGKLEARIAMMKDSTSKGIILLNSEDDFEIEMPDVSPPLSGMVKSQK